jgi:hypothetical protein
MALRTFAEYAAQYQEKQLREELIHKRRPGVTIGRGVNKADLIRMAMDWDAKYGVSAQASNEGNEDDDNEEGVAGDGLGDEEEEEDEGEYEDANETNDDDDELTPQSVSDTDRENEHDTEKQSDEETTEVSVAELIKEDVAENVRKFADHLLEMEGTTEEMKQPPEPILESVFKNISNLHTMWNIEKEGLFEDGFSENDDAYRMANWRDGWLVEEKKAMLLNREEYLKWKMKPKNCYMK